MLHYEIDLKDKSKWVITAQNEVHKSMPFYLTEIGNFYANSNYFTERSDENSFFLVYTVSGSGLLEIEDLKIELLPNHALILNCKNWHSYKTYSKSTWIDYWCHIKGNGLNGYFDFLENKLIEIDSKYNFIECFEVMLRLSQQSNILNAATISNKISYLLTEMLSSSLKNNKKINKYKFEVIYKSINFMEENYNKKITVQQVSSYVNLSNFHFTRMFSEQEGISPYNFLINLRINKSKNLLCTTSDTIKKISENVGYSSESNFVSQFKKHTGFTPALFRKNNINSSEFI